MSWMIPDMEEREIVTHENITGQKSGAEKVVTSDPPKRPESFKLHVVEECAGSNVRAAAFVLLTMAAAVAAGFVFHIFTGG